MKVSIITVCYNSGKTIEDTIKSVLKQSYQNIEYIIIDGQSKDNTLQIVNEYKNQISKIVSEPDKGMYDACNKGIKMASGDIIAILNSDDVYTNEKVIENVVEKFKLDNKDTLYADLKYVAADDLSNVVRYWKSGLFKRGKFLFGWMPPHPTFFVKKEVYQKYGLFNTKFRSAADYELMLRFLFKNKVSVSYLPKVAVLMREGGISNVSIKNRFRANSEDKEAWGINDLESFFFTTWLKPVRKLPQFLYRFKIVNYFF